MSVKEATATEVYFLPVFILEEYMTKAEPEVQFGYPSRYFLAKALPLFAEQFKKFLVAEGRAAEYFIKLKKSFDLKVFVNDDVYQDFSKQVDKLKANNVEVVVCPDAFIIDPETRTGTGNLYSVFTPFKNRVFPEYLRKKPQGKPNLENLQYLPENDIQKLSGLKEISFDHLFSRFSKSREILIAKEVVDLNEYLPLPDLSRWYFSEKEAWLNFRAFVNKGNFNRYEEGRNDLGSDGSSYKRSTSRLSLALAWGLISSRQVVAFLEKTFGQINPSSGRLEMKATLTFISELIWREFYRYQLFHHPELMQLEFQERFRNLTWVNNREAKKRFLSWLKGETGYSLVDAAQRQIASEGYMHNRARMVTASILTKNLGVNWRWGQEYFRAALIDLDEASNNGGWQWSASVGTDPKPIRIFNAELQAKKYDSDSLYQKRWLREDYNFLPLVEHKQGREEAIERYGLK